jgi:hypothetical protein
MHNLAAKVAHLARNPNGKETKESLEIFLGDRNLARSLAHGGMG